jgi:HSP20 family protein
MKYLVNRRNNIGNWVREFDHLARNLWTDNANSFGLSVNIWENGDGYHLEAALPGFQEKDVTVTVKENLLTIAGKQEKAVEEEEREYLLKERSGHEFSRSFHLPKDADAGNVSATFKNGLLNLTVAKKAESQPRNIEIKGE